MFPRAFFSALALAMLSFAGCQKPQVTSYRVPKEKDPELPAGVTASPSPGAGDMAAMPVPTAGGDGLTWTAPTHWKSKPPAPMRKATYIIPGDGGAEAELSITAFPGDVGGELANLNRWRGQAPFQLPPITGSELAAAVVRREHDGLKFGVVELVNQGAPASRLLGAWLPFAGGTWFYKLTGPDALVAKEKPAFLAFLDSIKPAPGSP